MESRDRLSLLTLTLSLLAGLVGVPSAQGTVYMTQQQALAQAFPGARIERRAFVLTEAQIATLEQRAKAKAKSRLVNAYVAWRGDTLVGTAFFDSRIVRTMPGVFMISVGPDTTVQRVDVLAFHEPPDYRPTPRWLDQFRNQSLGDRLWPDRDIRMLSGATLTTRSVTESTRLALACYEILVAPTLKRGPPPRRR